MAEAGKQVRAFRLWLVTLVIVAVFFTGAGSLWSAKAQTESQGVVIKKEEGPAGHETIGIEEKSIDIKSYQKTPLTFSVLSAWNFNPDEPSMPPEEIKNLDGRLVQVTGFMYPLQEGETIQYFCLLRTTQTCCYGPRPQFNQYIFVEMKNPTPFRRLAPVTCIGLFKVDPNPEEGFIYRMEGISCEEVESKK